MTYCNKTLIRTRLVSSLSFLKIQKKEGPSIFPYGLPGFTDEGYLTEHKTCTLAYPRVER